MAVMLNFFPSGGQRIRRAIYGSSMSTSASPSTDSSLLSRVRRHEAEAWQMFSDLYGPLIYGWARRQGLEREDAADVLQETFLAVARSISTRQGGGPGSFRAWLWAITGNKIRDHFRQRGPGGGVGGTAAHALLEQAPAAAWPDSTDAIQPSDVAGLVHRGMAQVQSEVEQRTWRAFCLCVLQGRDTQSVAAELGMTTANVRQARSRILRRLRDLLGEFFT